MDRALQPDSKRILWLDYAKCIAIFNIVMSHVFDQVFGYEIRSWILSFNVQLFFIISGYFYKEQDSIKETVKKCFKHLLIPYFTFHFLLIVYHFGTQLILDPTFSNSLLDNLRNALMGILFGIKGIYPSATNLNIPIWFLAALFFCKILAQPILRAKKHKNIIIPLTVVVSILMTYLLSYQKISTLPLYFNHAIMAIPFYIFGTYLKKINLDRINKRGIELLITVVLFFITIFLSKVSQSPSEQIHPYNFSFGHNILLFYIVGIISSFFGIFLARFLSHWNFRLLSYWGQNTLIILGVHYVMIKYLKMGESIILGNVFNLTSFNVYAMYIGNISISIIIMFLCIPIIYIINKYFPFILGKFNNK